MIKSALVFCSASDKVSPMYFSEMITLGHMLAENKIELIFGGSRVGLMGSVADAVLKRGGKVRGVIPEYLNTPEIAHDGLTELIVVSDLLDRKKKMLSLADVAIASPGGIGTIDEITEVMALKQLGEHQKPIIFHNFLGFWNPLLEFCEELTYRHMIHKPLDELVLNFESAQDIITFLKSQKDI